MLFYHRFWKDNEFVGHLAMNRLTGLHAHLGLKESLINGMHQKLIVLPGLCHRKPAGYV